MNNEKLNQSLALKNISFPIGLVEDLTTAGLANDSVFINETNSKDVVDGVWYTRIFHYVQDFNNGLQGVAIEASFTNGVSLQLQKLKIKSSKFANNCDILATTVIKQKHNIATRNDYEGELYYNLFQGISTDEAWLSPATELVNPTQSSGGDYIGLKIKSSGFYRIKVSGLNGTEQLKYLSICL